MKREKEGDIQDGVSDGREHELESHEGGRGKRGWTWSNQVRRMGPHKGGTVRPHGSNASSQTIKHTITITRAAKNSVDLATEWLFFFKKIDRYSRPFRCSFITSLLRVRRCRCETEMSSKFGVPPMRPKDIVSCLAPLEITLDAENLENPHNLQKAYEVFIEWLMGVTRDELEVGDRGSAC